MVRTQIVVSVAVALLLAGACQEEGSDERSARGADAQGSGTPCPAESVPRVRSEVRAVAFVYGEGPVFVGLGTGDDVVRYTVDTKKHDGWYYYKSLWAIAPSYTGKRPDHRETDRRIQRVAVQRRGRIPRAEQLELRALLRTIRASGGTD